MPAPEAPSASLRAPACRPSVPAPRAPRPGATQSVGHIATAPASRPRSDPPHARANGRDAAAALTTMPVSAEVACHLGSCRQLRAASKAARAVAAGSARTNRCLRPWLRCRRAQRRRGGARGSVSNSRGGVPPGHLPAPSPYRATCVAPDLPSALGASGIVDLADSDVLIQFTPDPTASWEHAAATTASRTSLRQPMRARKATSGAR